MDEFEKDENLCEENTEGTQPETESITESEDDNENTESITQPEADNENTESITQPEADNRNGDENQEKAESEELNDELEGIRSKFQEILDETAETYLAGGDIQDFDDSDSRENGPEESPDPEKLCECCGERNKDASFGEDYPYCAECRTLMQHYPLSLKGIFALIFVLALTGVAIFYVFASNAELIDNALTADEYFKDGKIYSAIETYGNLLQSYTSGSDTLGNVAVPKKTAAKYAEMYASLENYTYAQSVIDQFFTESDLKNPAYRTLKQYTVKNECYTKILETINNALADENNTADDICALIEEIRSDENSDDFLIDYYKYILVQYMGEELEKQYDILTQLSEKYPDKWPVRYELCAVCSQLGKAEEAEGHFKEVIKHNSEDGAIYAYLADAYRFCETPDTDMMLKIIEDGFTVDGDSGYAATDLNRVKALAYLLKGDYDSAYDAAYQAYQTAYMSLNYGYSINNLAQCLYTYQLCAHLKGDSDGADSVKEILGYIGLEESKDIKSYIDGKTSLENIITDGEGDLA